LIKRKIEERPQRWHEVLLEALWAYRVSKHSAIKVTPFKLVYGQEAVLPMELNLQTPRIVHQDVLLAVEYQTMMMDGIVEVTESQFKALREIEKEKLKVTRAYNKRVKAKSFQIGDKVWKMILPIKSLGNDLPVGKDHSKSLGVVPGNSYFVVFGRECIA
jgi:hypothetical protein